MLKPILIVLWLALRLTAEAGTLALTFVHQPLTTLGTDGDAGIVIARVPVLTNAVPEGLLSHVASPNKILQNESAGVSDSNILSRLGISLSVVLVEGTRYEITMDLSGASVPAEHGVTLEAVVASAIECINKTIIDTNAFHGDSQQVVWRLNLKADAKTILALKQYQRSYEPRKSKRAEQDGARQPANAPDSKSKGNKKPKPESEERSR